ncbi:putative uncharacterized protein [Parachlamydia acanthamoebae UV-7]|uniref:Uncharacterized protein n=2 Tax=Parachlamydia acanthamoebae TaxID=83552 RepID=F8L0B7_PARAV|nr:hypothetical protein DB43_GC00020 [Parachlamydia acanthamoebae]CCB86647.1 putative uncharacterized protein [Parachlamydia acanthamoebae UV-7]
MIETTHKWLIVKLQPIWLIFSIVDMGKYRHLEGCFTAPLLMQGKEAPSA